MPPARMHSPHQQHLARIHYENLKLHTTNISQIIVYRDGIFIFLDKNIKILKLIVYPSYTLDDTGKGEEALILKSRTNFCIH